MTMMTFLKLGIQSFDELGRVFLATVIGLDPPPNLKVCPLTKSTSQESSFLETTFFLDPFYEEHGECAGLDWIVIAILSVLLFIVSWVPRWYIYEPLANARMNGQKGWDSAECQRYSQTCASLLDFVLAAMFGARILLTKSWLFQRYEWIHRIPTIDADFKFFYLYYAARFSAATVSIFFEDRKKDAFIAAFIHHMVTLGLVLGSANTGFIRYGGLIMFFFDWADIPLLAAKICKYLSKDSKDMFQFVANRLFELFALVFFLTRNVYYNYIVYAIYMDLTRDWMLVYFQCLVTALAVLQTYWLALILLAVQRQAESGGNISDIREEEDENNNKDKKDK